MAFRGGRGRGRGGFGRGGPFRFAKQESVPLFPDIELPDRSKITKDDDLLRNCVIVRRLIAETPYRLEDNPLGSKEESVDIERYSDRAKRINRFGQQSLERSGLLLEPGYFPVELVRGERCKTGRKVVWNPKRELKRLDLFEQLEEKLKDKEPKSKNEKEDDEDEEDEEEEIEGEEEDSDDGDYAENFGYDDDEDDFNMEGNGDDEALL